MNAYSLIVIFACCVCRYMSVEIMPELEKNILKFGYGINFKYKVILAHSFDRFYVVTKFILPSVNDLKFSPIGIDERCKYLNDDLVCNHNTKEYLSNFKVYCREIIPFMHYYKEQIFSYNHTAQNIITNEISLILPNFPEARVEKRCIIGSLISGFIGLACEGISSYLHDRRHKALHKAVVTMENKVNIQ